MSELPRSVVVMALAEESQGVFERAGIPLLYCGVGKVNATYALTRELARYRCARQALPRVINFGSAGSRHHVAGKLIACHEFVQRDMDVRGLGFARGATPFDELPARLAFAPVFTALPAAVCGTGDSFATADSAVACEVLDMEAYALARVCVLERTQFACAKYLTDGADHTAADDWRRNVHKAADEFLRLYLSLEQQAGVAD
jgi:adenosylhomocysteine nucleosidase